MIRVVTVYISKASAIVAANHVTPEGIVYEQDSPTILAGLAPAPIGEAFKRALAAFSVRQCDMRTAKKSDWPAFRVSCCSSMKRFEKDFRRVTIVDINEGGVIVRASTPAIRNADLEIASRFSPYGSGEVLGRKILEVVQYEEGAEPGATDNPDDAQRLR